MTATIDPSERAGIEAMFRATGGVHVLVPDDDTWGHLDPASTADPWAQHPPALRQRHIVTVSRLALDPVVGTEITVDGEQVEVLDARLSDDGELYELIVGDWTHAVDVYRPERSGTASRGQQQTSYSPVSRGLRCDLWGATGEIRSQASGPTAIGDWRAAFPPVADVMPADRLRVTSGPTRQGRFRVTFVDDADPDGRIMADLDESQEDF